jgi:hypothetical protein
MTEITPITCKRFLLESEDEILHVVEFRKGFVVYFYNNAYETEPWQTGANILPTEAFEKKFNLKL